MKTVRTFACRELSQKQMSCVMRLPIPAMKTWLSLSGMLLALAAAAPPRSASAGENALVLAQSPGCQWAVDRYNSALSNISYAVSRYANCVGSSRGNDDCSMEFRRLKNAQSDFEQATMAYRFDCD